jgi:outer membrane protein assembly factor BamD (BamD/ComL family)
MMARKKLGLAKLIFLFLLTACSSPGVKDAEKKQADSTMRLAKNYLTDCSKLYRQARQWDSVLLNQMEVDPASAAYALKAFTDFAYYCKSDSMSPVYLVKTAQVARAVNNIPQARTALDRCIEEYPAFRNRAAAIFLLAQLYDEPNYLNNEQEARKLYKEIVDEYPKSDWAMSAKAAIGFIGKTDEQIMQELKRKNQNK